MVLTLAKVATHVVEHRGHLGLGLLLNQPEQLLTLRAHDPFRMVGPTPSGKIGRAHV